MKILASFVLGIFFFTNLFAACIPPLPVAHANNAVAELKIKGKHYVFSFACLTSSKTWKDT